ncbi:MAG: zf-HC2 domain-containing protein [Bacteroidales bacterium]|nr:zf-HC2 domain-containing protein [Bacteroidales bacterium]
MPKTKNNNGCQFIRNNLFSYVERQLTVDERQRFENHLLTCPDCTVIVSGFRSVPVLLEALKAKEPNPFIQTRTFQHIETELLTGSRSSFDFFRTLLKPLILTFTIISAVAIGFTIGKQTDKKFSQAITHQNDLETIKSHLYISDIMDEDKTFFGNP